MILCCGDALFDIFAEDGARHGPCPARCPRRRFAAERRHRAVAARPEVVLSREDLARHAGHQDHRPSRARGSGYLARDPGRQSDDARHRVARSRRGRFLCLLHRRHGRPVADEQRAVRTSFPHHTGHSRRLLFDGARTHGVISAGAGGKPVAAAVHFVRSQCAAVDRAGPGGVARAAAAGCCRTPISSR